MTASARFSRGPFTREDDIFAGITVEEMIMKQQEIKKFIDNNDSDAVLSWMLKDATEEEQRAAYEIIMDTALNKLSLPPKPAPTLEPKRPREG